MLSSVKEKMLLAEVLISIRTEKRKEIVVTKHCLKEKQTGPAHFRYLELFLVSLLRFTPGIL